jgi:hypothetical protein
MNCNLLLFKKLIFFYKNLIYPIKKLILKMSFHKDEFDDIYENHII